LADGNWSPTAVEPDEIRMRLFTSKKAAALQPRSAIRLVLRAMKNFRHRV
jgi:hypothetical protein